LRPWDYNNEFYTASLAMHKPMPNNYICLKDNKAVKLLNILKEFKNYDEILNYLKGGK